MSDEQCNCDECVKKQGRLSKIIQVRVTKAFYKEAAETAAAHKTTVSDLGRLAIREKVKELRAS